MKNFDLTKIATMPNEEFYKLKTSIFSLDPIKDHETIVSIGLKLLEMFSLAEPDTTITNKRCEDILANKFYEPFRQEIMEMGDDLAEDFTDEELEEIKILMKEKGYTFEKAVEIFVENGFNKTKD